MAIKAAKKFLEQWLHAEHPRARNRRMLAAGIALIALWGVFGGQQGFFALISSQREKGRLRAEIEELKLSNQAMEGKLADLGRHPEAYEKVAREKLMLMRPGEVLYRFHD